MAFFEDKNILWQVALMIGAILAMWLASSLLYR
jgi:hypothetical protein